MKKLGDAVKHWAFSDAEWYQFWKPQSGVLCGLCFGTVTTTIAIVIFRSFVV